VTSVKFAALGPIDMMRVVPVALRSCGVFLEEGLQAAAAFLEGMGAPRRSSPGNLAHAGLVQAVCRAAVHLAFGPQTCLPESIASAAGLRALGYETEVVIGYEMAPLPSLASPVHAWVTVGGSPLDPAAHAYIPLRRLPVSTR
jgi:hypothetical protein